MALEKITQVTGRGVYVPGEDIDTDRIIPARFMKCITFDGLGEFAFYDERKAADGSLKPHPLNEERYVGAKFLLSGSNFGCGSSREHAPQALYRYGFRAVIAESFAEIFFGNSITLGMPCAVMAHDDIQALAGLIESDPAILITLDLLEGKVTAADMDFPATLPPHAKEALVQGKWDAIADLLESVDDIKNVAGNLAYFKAA
ncbi:3-isopropylmalate/(R)-2-methylmalate dehydratase small subunit [Terrimicrobium sacchariphilum]|jgi:3-isopropylmalate/(R)-2-methylmalate dehydratase small subunit|uniref:3-isopropylmalate dehydratase n=1 Tax=Terrimicrobium sacchariphilum TaxID=690879 RepID=A0A146GCW3_TERSA|nr:3-isopropylmalate dehydratase small subunit [Terrimicrobium sacchariphilum]GAT34992.1 3-isopropylmalate/(R)-2-methylmalate dehydratase small subunit [Terrimicrobium sacchariphilum]